MHGYSCLTTGRVCLEMLKEFNIRAEKLLDIGGSTGEFIVHLASVTKAERVYIVDIDVNVLAKARLRVFGTYRGGL